MEDLVKIENLKEKVREEIVLAMRRRVEDFKYYVTCNKNYEHPEREFIKDKDYGCKDGKYYYWSLPNAVQFIYQNSHWCSNGIFFNDKIKCWFVRDKDKKGPVTFEALDTDSQIACLEMLDHFIDWKNWSDL